MVFFNIHFFTNQNCNLVFKKIDISDYITYSLRTNLTIAKNDILGRSKRL